MNTVLHPPLGETGKETTSQGGRGGQNPWMSASEFLTQLESCRAQGGGRVADAPGGAGGSASALPCLNTFNCNERDITLSPSHAKTAYALKENCLLLVMRYGLERIGFLTFTFARHVVCYKEAQKALHSLMTGVLKGRYLEYIIVMERMTSKRIHYHLLVAMAQDIRTGFDFVAVKRGNYASAGVYLRSEWKFWRETAPKYGFGRTELLPIKKTAEGIAKYVGKYIAKQVGQRLPEDKGARLVRYSKGTNRVGTRFAWVSSGAGIWRAKLGTFCWMLHLNSDNYVQFFGKWFGRNWVYHLRPLIHSIKLPELYPAKESGESIQAVWLVVQNERGRLNPCRTPRVLHPAGESPAVNAPASHRNCIPVSWIERTVKDD